MFRQPENETFAANVSARIGVEKGLAHSTRHEKGSVRFCRNKKKEKSSHEQLKEKRKLR